MHIQQWPEEVIALQRELASGLHPKLSEKLNAVPGDDFAERIATIAAYCEIVLDGYYDVNDICVICKNCLRVLEAKRERPDAPIVLLN